MKLLLIVLTAAVVLAITSALAVLNNACKTDRRAWCASDIRHAKTAYR